MDWRLLFTNGSNSYIRAFSYDGTEIMDLHGQRIMVQVDASRVNLFTGVTALAKFIPRPDHLRLTIPDELVSVGTLKAHFAERDAVIICARYEHCRAELADDRKIWRYYEFPGRELVLARNISTGWSLRPRWITVAIHCNGVTLHAKPLVKKYPLDVGKIVARIPPDSMNIWVLKQYMPQPVAQEVIAVFRMNRRSLMRVINCEAVGNGEP